MLRDVQTKILWRFAVAVFRVWPAVVVGWGCSTDYYDVPLLDDSMETDSTSEVSTDSSHQTVDTSPQSLELVGSCFAADTDKPFCSEYRGTGWSASHGVLDCLADPFAAETTPQWSDTNSCTPYNSVGICACDLGDNQHKNYYFFDLTASVAQTTCLQRYPGCEWTGSLNQLIGSCTGGSPFYSCAAFYGTFFLDTDGSSSNKIANVCQSSSGVWSDGDCSTAQRVGICSCGADEVDEFVKYYEATEFTDTSAAADCQNTACTFSP